MYDLRSNKRKNTTPFQRSAKVSKVKEEDDIFDPDMFISDEESDESSEEEIHESSQKYDVDISAREMASNIFCDFIDTHSDPLNKYRSGLSDETRQTLSVIEATIKDQTPTLEKILTAKLPLREKVRAVQYFKIFSATQRNTEDYIDLSARINDILQSAGDSCDFELEVNYDFLQNKLNSKHPTIDRIINAKLTNSDKVKVFQLYHTLRFVRKNTDRWNEICNAINNILSTEFATLEEAKKMEEQEKSLSRFTLNFNANIKKEILELDADIDIKSKLYEMYTEMMSYDMSSSHYSDIKQKLLWAIKLPHRKVIAHPLVDKSPENISKYCHDIYQKLDAELYGMKEVKEKVIQALNDRIYNSSSQSLLALKGKPGVGKTKLARTIAKAAGLPFEKINLGGAIDSTLFKGSDGVWSGAAPSMLLQILSKVKFSNAVILLDEIDKLSTSEKGVEVQNALLHILDSSQNDMFQDTFLCEFPHDISKIWFIPSLNDDTNLHPALKDRLNIVEIPSYNHEEMVEIIKRHTLPNMLLDKGFNENDISMTDGAAKTLLNVLGNEVGNSGMRIVERAVADMISKINLVRSLCPDYSLQLTYTVPNYKGLPYKITCETVHALCKNKDSNNCYQPMYM